MSGTKSQIGRRPARCWRIVARAPLACVTPQAEYHAFHQLRNTCTVQKSKQTPRHYHSLRAFCLEFLRARAHFATTAGCGIWSRVGYRTVHIYVSSVLLYKFPRFERAFCTSVEESWLAEGRADSIGARLCCLRWLLWLG